MSLLDLTVPWNVPNDMGRVVSYQPKPPVTAPARSNGPWMYFATAPNAPDRRRCLPGIGLEVGALISRGKTEAPIRPKSPLHTAGNRKAVFVEADLLRILFEVEIAEPHLAPNALVLGDENVTAEVTHRTAHHVVGKSGVRQIGRHHLVEINLRTDLIQRSGIGPEFPDITSPSMTSNNGPETPAP